MHTMTNNIIVDESGSASQIENYKIVIIGDQHVGKTSIISKYKYETIEDNYAPTVGIDFLTKNVFLEDKTIRLIMWDTAGQERFKSLIPSYLKNAHSIILTYDITSKNSFNSLNKWLEDIKNHVQDNVFIVLCGNKIDLNNKRQVNFEDAQKFAKDNDLVYIETSAITGEGINKLFDLITKSFYDGGISIGNESQVNERSIVLQSNNNVIDEGNNKKNCCTNTKKKEKKK